MEVRVGRGWASMGTGYRKREGRGGRGGWRRLITILSGPGVDQHGDRVQKERGRGGGEKTNFLDRGGDILGEGRQKEGGGGNYHFTVDY